MEKSLNFSSVFHRRNIIKEFFMGLFLAIASYPRLLLEVFLRRNMGERYFSFASVITVFLILVLFPFLLEKTFAMRVVWDNTLWYLFLILFLYVGNQRRLEIKRLPSVFDFARYSLDQGLLHPLLRQLALDRNFNIRTMNILVEPGVFLVIGILFLLISQSLLGGLLILSALLFSFSYMAAYHYGDQMVMDLIDKIIVSEEKMKSFIDDEDPSRTRGVHFYGRKPADKSKRRKVMEWSADRNDSIADVL
jgi:hypothetical protein